MSYYFLNGLFILSVYILILLKDSNMNVFQSLTRFNHKNNYFKILKENKILIDSEASEGICFLQKMQTEEKQNKAKTDHLNVMSDRRGVIDFY